MGSVVGKLESPECVPETKLEAKMVEAMRQRASKGTIIRSFDSIILKFPKIDDNLRTCKTSFEQFGEFSVCFCSLKCHFNYMLERTTGHFNLGLKVKFQAFNLQINILAPKIVMMLMVILRSYVLFVDEDSNGTIDRQELKECFDRLEIPLTEEEIDDLFDACDISAAMGMKFNEFIVLLCLVYLLKDDPNHVFSKSKFGMPKLEETFESLVDAFVFLDKNRDGYVSKSEMISAINETTSGARSSGRIAMRRFEEMDWDKNGMVNFKEFLFAFTRWVGIDENEDAEEEEEEE